MPQPNLFAPGATLILAPSAGSVSSAIAGTPRAMRVYNEGPGNVYLRIAYTQGAAATASSANMIVPAGYLEYFQLAGHDRIAAYCASNATVNVTFGDAQ